LPQGRLDPAAACDGASVYAAYFGDVTSLDIEETAQAPTMIYEGEGCNRRKVDERSLFYMFGRAPSGRIYWSVYDPADGTGYAQSFWREITRAADPGKGARVTRIIGVTPYVQSQSRGTAGRPGGGGLLSGIYDMPSRARIRADLYVFYVLQDALGEHLKFIRLNLDQMGNEAEWETDPKDLPLPPPGRISDFEILPVQNAAFS
jgi:hypothetical protein